MGSSISSNTTANEHEETQHERGHSYSNIVISGNSQVHNGNVLNVSNFYGQWPDALPRNIWNGGTCNLSGTSTKRKRSVDDDDVGHRTPGEGNPFLDMAIDHLSEFSTSLQHQKQDAGAQKILSWIGVILEAVESSCAASKTPHTAEEVARIQNGLLLTNRVGINLAGRRKLPEQVIGTKRKSSHVVFDKWKIALDTLSCKALDEHGRDVTECFSALRLEPLDFTSASPLAAFFGERTDCLHTTVIHPTIFAFRCVSSESEVFEAIMEDDIAGLIKVFAEQKATIRDCDEEGRSLLHVRIITQLLGGS